jgi:hypothetical protein
MTWGKNPSPTRRPFAVIAKGKHDDGTRWITYEVDTWEGGSAAEETGMWYRQRQTVTAKNVRAFVSPSVSFWGELQKALA